MMKDSDKILIRQNNGHTIKVTHYYCQKHPRAAVLILHGMAEHQERYRDFAQYLNDKGFDCYTYNHRGHGTECKLSDLGYFGAKNGDRLIVEDAIMVSQYIKKNNRCHSFFLFGHSMGAVIARNVIQSFDSYNGVILCGSPYPPRLQIHAGYILASVIKHTRGTKHISPYLNSLMFGGKKYFSLSSRTAYDWLSRSNPVVGAYIHDPYCGFTCTASFYYDFLKLLINAAKKNLVRLTRTELPLYIIAGEKDPVGGYGRNTHKFLVFLKRMGFSDITSKLYPECRHELLNELNKEDIYKDIYQWIIKKAEK